MGKDYAKYYHFYHAYVQKTRSDLCTLVYKIHQRWSILSSLLIKINFREMKKKNKMKSCVDNKIFNLIYFSTLYLSKPESFSNPLRQKWKVFFNCATKESILIWEILVQNIKRKILYALTCLIPILYWTQNSAVSDILLFEKVVCPELNCDHNFHKIFAQKINAYKI